MKVYIDANIFLYPLLKDDSKADRFKEIIFGIVTKKFDGITSVLTWDEIVFITRKFLGRKISIIEGAKFLRVPNLVFIDTTKNIIREAQRLIEIYNLKPRDAIHIATALSQNCAEIISDDLDFDVVKEIKRIAP